ncbi:MAG: NADH:ubiquinone reductase (Na(+)-transporting) subunit B [Gammaproteobacteria bacterium]
MGLRRVLDRVRPLFVKGGRFENFHAVFEAVDTFFYTPEDVTRVAPHVRDGLDLKRVMIYVWIAVFPCALFGSWNVGFQANVAMADLGVLAAPGWRGEFLAAFGLGYDPLNVIDCLVHGLLYFLPIYLVAFFVGIAWEILFAAVRNHEVNEGFFVTSILFALILPPTIPLWQVALGISFAVVFAKEAFGGTGKNFLNPALAGRAFLFFAYPAQISGDAVWTAVDGFTGATPLTLGTAGGVDAIVGAGDYGAAGTGAEWAAWMDAFIGSISGSIGSTSALLCLLGGLFLLVTKIASWRIVAGVFVGMVATATVFNLLDGGINPAMQLPWHWHLVTGGFAFGMMFMATDPVSASMTSAGRWIFGALVGFLTVLIRVLNPAFPEGIMLAILFANLVAPLIDWGVVRINVRRRIRRERSYD